MAKHTLNIFPCSCNLLRFNNKVFFMKVIVRNLASAQKHLCFNQKNTQVQVFSWGYITLLKVNSCQITFGSADKELARSSPAYLISINLTSIDQVKQCGNFKEIYYSTFQGHVNQHIKYFNWILFMMVVLVLNLLSSITERCSSLVLFKFSFSFNFWKFAKQVTWCNFIPMKIRGLKLGNLHHKMFSIIEFFWIS